MERYKNLLKRSNFKHSIIEGSNLNIGSNLIHFLDAYEFILDTKILRIEIDKSIFAKNSKRNGFLEFFGKITLFFENSFILEIISKDSEDTNSEIKFLSKNGDLISIYNESSLFFNQKIMGKIMRNLELARKLVELY